MMSNVSAMRHSSPFVLPIEVVADRDLVVEQRDVLMQCLVVHLLL